MRNALGIVALISSAALALTGCTNSERPSTMTATTSQTTPTTTGAATTKQAFGKVCPEDAVKVEGAFGTAPKVTLPTDCDPPTTLVIKDLIPGRDPAVKAGDAVTVNYQLTSWSTGKVVDESFGRKPFEVKRIGAGEVIPGWEEGLIGLKTNGRRLLIIPPDKGYGPQGSPPDIPPNDTLVFVVDGVSITTP